MSHTIFLLTPHFPALLYIRQPYLLTLHQLIKKSVKLIEMDIKLVEYSESSDTSGGEEPKHTDSRKIAVVQPVQQTVPESEPISENPLETSQPEYEVNPNDSSPSSPPTEHPEAKLFTTDEYSEIPLEIEMPEPEELSSNSDTVSFITDTTLGE